FSFVYGKIEIKNFLKISQDFDVREQLRTEEIFKHSRAVFSAITKGQPLSDNSKEHTANHVFFSHIHPLYLNAHVYISNSYARSLKQSFNEFFNQNSHKSMLIQVLEFFD